MIFAVSCKYFNLIDLALMCYGSSETVKNDFRHDLCHRSWKDLDFVELK